MTRHGQVANLYGTVCCNQLVLEVRRPQAKASEVHEQVLVHYRELSTEHPPHVDVAGVWLKALVVAQNLHTARAYMVSIRPRLAQLPIAVGMCGASLSCQC